MPALGFATNFLWVLVMGLLGPSLPAIIADLGISHAQAGFFFTMLSLGSLVGSSVGAIASDYLHRKLLYGACILILGIGLALLGVMPGYASLAAGILLLSLFGSPIGAIGQSIMLDQFPEARERNLARQTSFAAVGSFVAPMIVSLNVSIPLPWRWAFMETALLPLVLFVVLLATPIPAVTAVRRRANLRVVTSNRVVLACAVLIFFSVAIDVGFSYWLAQYFASELSVGLDLSSAVVGIYLVGIFAGRMLIPTFLKRMSPRANLILGLSIAVAAIALFIAVPVPVLKAALSAVYGFGVAPVFPLLMARGTRQFPEQSGSVTGVLFGTLSLGGMAFPLLLGALSSQASILRSYLLCGAVAVGLLITMIAWREKPAPVMEAE